jgi:lipopolysaccharide export system protein LptA
MLALGLGALVVWSPLARAAGVAGVAGEALELAGERLDVDVERGTALLRGNVTVTFGHLEVRCTTVEMTYDGSPRIGSARATGNVTARLQGVEATAEVLELDVGARTASLQGGVRLTRGKGWLAAGSATVDLVSGKVSLRDVRGSIPIAAGAARSLAP